MHILHHLPVFSLLSLLLVIHVHGATYWLDQNCGPDVERAIDEAREGAARMVTRMNTQANDPYMQWLSTTILRGGPDTSTFLFAKFKTFLDRMSTTKFTKVDDSGKAASDIRFYCDDDDRWKELASDPNPNAPQNANRPFASKEFIDVDNYIKRTGNTIACKQPKSKSQIHIAGSYFSYTQLPGTPGDQNKLRQTITLCKDLLDLKYFTYQDAISNGPPTDWPNFNSMDLIVTHVIVHELMHSSRFNTNRAVDDHPDPAWEGTDESKRPSLSGYNWGGVTKMDSTDLANLRSVRNPDSFAYWVALGRFWDNQFKASQDPRDLPRGKFIKDTSAPVNPYPPPAAKGRLVMLLRL